MDLSTALANVNYLAVLTAALSSFLVGGLWYSPALFARPWLADNRLQERDLVSPGPVFLGAFVCAVVQALVMAMFVGPRSDAGTGALAGLLVGLGWVAPAMTCTPVRAPSTKTADRRRRISHCYLHADRYHRRRLALIN